MQFSAGNFQRNLSYHSAAERLPLPTAPDMDHDASDNLYWTLWYVSVKAELGKIIDADSLNTWVRHMNTFQPVERYTKTARKLEIERERLNAEAECTCTPFDTNRCPACCKIADEGEMPY